MLPEEAGQLRGERLAGGEFVLLLEPVCPPLELADVGLGLLVRSDGLAYLSLVDLARALELGEVELRAEELAEPGAESVGRARARSQ